MSAFTFWVVVLQLTVVNAHHKHMKVNVLENATIYGSEKRCLEALEPIEKAQPKLDFACHAFSLKGEFGS